MDKYLIKKDTLTAIADAIRAKTGSTEAINTGDMASSIKGIGIDLPTSTLIDSICFWDIDGTLVLSMSVNDATNLNELPVPNGHDELVFVGWNYTLEEIKTLNRPLDIGAIYNTVDGKIHLTLNVSSSSYKTVPIHFMQSIAGGIIVDWGDGVTTTSGDSIDVATSLTHAYSLTGAYQITITIVDGCTMTLGGGTSSTCFVGGSTSTYQNYLIAAKLPSGVKLANWAIKAGKCELLSLPPDLIEIPNYGLYYLNRINAINIPSGVTSIGSFGLSGTTKSKTKINNIICLPESVTTLGENCFYECAGINRLILPTKILEIPNGSIYNCTSLESIILPPSLQKIGSNFLYSSYLIMEVCIPETVTSIGSSFCYNCYSLKILKLPNALEVISSTFCNECYSLESLYIPDAVTTIERTFLNHCYSLKKIRIHKNVTSIEAGFCNQCYSCLLFEIFGNVTFTGSDSTTMLSNAIIVTNQPMTDSIIALGKYKYIWFVPDSEVSNYSSKLGSSYKVMPISQYSNYYDSNYYDSKYYV